MTQQQIQQLFQLRYNQNNWKQFLSQAFSDARLLSSPDVLTGVNTDVATQVMRLGYIALNENGIERTIAIYDVTLAPGIILERNRVGLRNLLRKYWKDVDAAFIVYHRPENPNWRLTYVSELTGFDAEGELIKVKTEPKRYTYILGEGESCRTAAERFAIITRKGNKTSLDDIKEAFSVEKLSKSFFDEYKKHYELFCDYMVSKPNIRQAIFSGDEKAIRDFNKKLLGRIVFLYFIQKKGWLGVPEGSKWGQGDPNFLSNLFNNARNKGLFYSEYLARLFFDTLNTPRPNDIIELIKGEPVKIPFLNGGLFEEDNKIYRDLILPAELFENLFLFFNQYNFTIYEDDPNDHTVAVDPEMLGHIFENLLEDNKDKGAFYTPKEIVHYMCQESLIEYLKNSPPSEGWQTKSNGVVNSPPLEGWPQAGVVNSPPLEGWPQAGVVKRASKNYFDLPYNPKLKERARKLRKAGNLSEVLFWNRVKNKGFRGFDFDRQKIIGHYIVDFYCTNCNVVIEIDGSSHDNKQEYDAERDRYLKKLGLEVIHIPVEDVMQDMDGVMEMLDDHPALKGTPPEEGNELPLATPEEGNELPLATPEEGNELPLATPEEGNELPLATPEEGNELPLTPPEEGNEPHLTPLKGNWEENVIHLIKYKNPQNLNQHEIQQINDALDKVKICDPAIGSGAFPMGLLKEIFTAKQTLYTFEHGNTEGFDASAVKLNIIQNSIYGVDIEKGAVDIARLRFWLSLVVDEEAPKALPNLDYKIVVGNSLVSKLGDDIIDIDWNLNETSYGLFGAELATEKIELLKQITAKQKEFFNPQNSPPPEGWQTKSDGVVNSPPLEGWPKAGVVKKKLATDIRKLKIDLLINQLELMIKTQGIETRPTGNGKAIAKQTQRYLETLGWKQQIEKLKKLKNSPPKEGAGGGLDFFDWKLDFPEVLNPILVNDNGGFDIVIGNPPYVQLQKMGISADELEAANFKVFSRTGDIYELFYEKGVTLLKQNAVLTYITSNKWMRTNYGKSTREYFVKNTQPVVLVDFGNVQIFESATVDTNILILRKTDVLMNSFKACRFTHNHIKLNDIDHFIESKTQIVIFTGQDAWVIADFNKSEIINKVKKKGIPLKDWNITINYGIKTGYNEAFIVDKLTKEKLISEDPKSVEIIKPILRGRDIEKWLPDFADLWLINSHNGIKERKLPRVNVPKDYHAIYEHLMQFRDQLEKRNDHGEHWTNLRNCAYVDDFEKPKIIYPNMTKYLPFVYDNNTHYFHNDKSFHITGESLFWLVSFLNSTFFKQCFSDEFPELQGGTRELRKVFLDKIPVLKIPMEKERIFETIVNQILLRKSQSQDTTALEQQIDNLVYKLYELTYEEVLIIEPEFAERMSREEYEKLEIENG